MRTLIALSVLTVMGFAAWSAFGRNQGTEETDRQLQQPAASSAPQPKAAELTTLEGGLQRLLEELILNPGLRGDQPAVQKRLDGLMKRFLAAKEDLRAEIAAMTSQAVLKEMARFAPPGGQRLAVLPPLAIKAVEDRAKTLASGLRKMIEDPSARHQGTLMGGSGDFPIPEGYTRASWRVIGGYDYKEGMKLPAHILALDGMKVSAAGFMLGLDADQDIHEFLLVESQWSCCFGKVPELHELFVVRVPKDQPGVDLTGSRVVVSGRLEVGEEVDEGFVTSVYRIVADQMVDLRQ